MGSQERKIDDADNEIERIEDTDITEDDLISPETGNVDFDHKRDQAKRVTSVIKDAGEKVKDAVTGDTDDSSDS